jgi:probable rRNA maturation factor
VTVLVRLDASRGGRGATAAGRRLQRLARRFLAELGHPGELSLALVKDPEIRALKARWLGQDEATDVLSFPAGDEGPSPGPRLLGDVVISLDTARRVARRLGTPVEHELALYLAHGLLHLLGHDHQSPRQEARMRRAENALLGEAGMLGRQA